MDLIDTTTLFLILLGMFNLVFLLFLLVERRTNKKFRAKYLQLLEGLHTENVENLVLEYSGLVNDVLMKADNLEKDLGSLKEQLAGAIQKTGMVRFNAFPGLGSDQSFSLALLDSYEDGIVLTSIFGRDDSRFFAKPIRKGRSRYRLTDEEVSALDRARKDAGMSGSLSKGEEESS